MDLDECGRSTSERINYLIANLTEDEWYNYFRLRSFIRIWEGSTGGLFDINEHTKFFRGANTYALRQIDAVFFRKFGRHIEERHQLEMSDDEWVNGIKPLSR